MQMANQINCKHRIQNSKLQIYDNVYVVQIDKHDTEEAWCKLMA